MTPLNLTAAQFLRTMSTGRTRPVLLICQDPAAASSEVVVKLRGPELTGVAQAAELIVAQVAEELGLQVPQPAIVEITAEFARSIPDRTVVAQMDRSLGLNFGSIHLGPGFTTWPVAREPQGVQRDQAADIFAFDTLAQNPDRRANNPNVWSKSDRLGILDNEQAFSFLSLPILGGARKPWQPSASSSEYAFLQQHVFYQPLRGKQINLGPFEERLKQLSDERIGEIVASVPSEWLEGTCFAQDFTAYIYEARAESRKLVDFVKHALR